MLNEIEETPKVGLEFFLRSLEMQSPQAISRAHKHLIALEKVEYANIEEVQKFRDELEQVQPH